MNSDCSLRESESESHANEEGYESGASSACLATASYRSNRAWPAPAQAVDIAVCNEQGQFDFVDIDQADDEHEFQLDLDLDLDLDRDRDRACAGLQYIVSRCSSGRLRSSHSSTSSNAEPPTGGSVSKIRHRSIAERMLRRRNSEHALQQAMHVAQGRKQALAALLHEHEQIVKEVEKWSLLSLQADSQLHVHCAIDESTENVSDADDVAM